MLQTNYYIFDLLDFDPSLSVDESLWKAYAPTAIEERNGDVVITVPFQKQLLQNDMAADMSVEAELHQIVVSAYRNDVVRLFVDFDGGQPDDQSAMLDWSSEAVKTPLTLVNCDGLWSATDSCGRTRLTVDTRGYKVEHWSDLLPAPQPTPEITLYPDGTTALRLSSRDHFSPPRYDALPVAFCKSGTQRNRATVSIEATADECFAGTGERFRKMDLSGQTFRLKNQDGQGVNNRRAYKNIPFYLSNRPYGAFLHTSAYSKFSLCDHSTRSVEMVSDKAAIDLFVIGGGTPEAILRHYRELTGFPSMPPLWSFGIWMSRMSYFSADEVESICHRLRAEHYPCDVIHLDTGWFRTDWLCEWKFNEERFPDPEAFIKRLAANGWKVSLWQLPYVADGAEQLDEARRNNYIAPLTKRQQSDGSNFSALDYAGTIDFTSAKATEWYKGLLRRLLEMGVRCIKTDFGENIHLDALYENMKPELLNNLYALLYQRAAYEVTKEVTGEGIVWARAAWAGCQRYPLHWGGDSASTWDGMAGSLRGGLHFGLSGFAFWSHDVPGFHSLPDFMNSPIDPKLYMRWTEFGVFTSHFRYHGTRAREPWEFPTIAPTIKRWWRLRYALLPYIVEQSRAATRSGLPLLQAMAIQFHTDRNVWHIDDQYMFGEKILAAPVMNGDDRREVYLPQGEWVDLFTAQHYQSAGQWFGFESIPIDQMPLFARPHTSIEVCRQEVECTDQIDWSKCETIVTDDRFEGLFKELNI